MAVEVFDVMSLDPGGTSGWTHWRQDSHRVGGQLGPHMHHLELMQLLVNTKPRVIVCERFDYRPGQEHANLMAKEYIGVARLYAQSCPHPVEFVEQPALVGKSKSAFWNDKKLKKAGFYTKGAPHQNDATRHLLHYLVEVRKERWLLDLLR